MWLTIGASLADSSLAGRVRSDQVVMYDVKITERVKFLQSEIMKRGLKLILNLI